MKIGIYNSLFKKLDRSFKRFLSYLIITNLKILEVFNQKYIYLIFVFSTIFDSIVPFSADSLGWAGYVQILCFV